MKILSKRKWVNVLALGIAFLGLYYAAPEISGRIGNSPNIVLISIDTMRADYFTPHHMPQTWKWANENCMHFTNAHANSTWTLPSHLTILTGLLPHEHQVEGAVDQIPEDVEMVQQRLRRKGYRTVAFTSGGFVGSIFGFSRGFSEWYENNDNALESFSECKEYLASLSGGRFEKPNFIFLHTFYIHWFDDSDTKKYGEFYPDKYEDRVRDFDKVLLDMINAILDSSLSDNLRMIITSDHGEGFGEIYSNLYEREFVSEYHGDWPSPSQVEIPLLVYDSHNDLKGSSDKLVGLDNLCPTIEVWADIADSDAKHLFNSDERDFLISEAIPLFGLDRLARKGEDMKKRGMAKIVGKGEYIETSAAKPGAGEKSVQKIELTDEKRKELEALGYLFP
jgi:membrane-anchored protein YejM (alkaline phosphatase superfamily)